MQSQKAGLCLDLLMDYFRICWIVPRRVESRWSLHVHCRDSKTLKHIPHERLRKWLLCLPCNCLTIGIAASNNTLTMTIISGLCQQQVLEITMIAKLRVELQSKRGRISIERMHSDGMVSYWRLTGCRLVRPRNILSEIFSRNPSRLWALRRVGYESPWIVPQSIVHLDVFADNSLDYETVYRFPEPQRNNSTTACPQRVPSSPSVRVSESCLRSWFDREAKCSIGGFRRCGHVGPSCDSCHCVNKSGQVSNRTFIMLLLIEAISTKGGCFRSFLPQAFSMIWSLHRRFSKLNKELIVSSNKIRFPA